MFYCLNETTGDLIWSQYTLGRVANPAIAEDSIFVGCGGTFSGGARLYAFGEKHVIPADLSLDLSSETSLIGFKVTLSGFLKGLNNSGIKNGAILLSYSVNDGQSWNDITQISTSEDGEYSAIWQPSATGTFLVRALWADVYPFQSTTAMRMLSVTTYDGQYVFSVTSNSTVSALVFNSTSTELDFYGHGKKRMLQ